MDPVSGTFAGFGFFSNLIERGSSREITVSSCPVLALCPAVSKTHAGFSVFSFHMPILSYAV